MSCPSSSKGKNTADDTCGAYAEAEESETLECSYARSSSEGKNLANDTWGAVAEAEESEIVECSSARSSSEGKNLEDDTRGACAEEVRNEALEGCDCQQNTISSSEDDHIHFPPEDDHIHSSEDDHLSHSSEDDHLSHSSEDDHFSHGDGEEGHVCSSTPVEDVWESKIIEKSLHTPERLRLSSGSKSCSIHQVPYSLRKHNKGAYNPQLISIGPFHYGKRKNDRLRTMEEHKWNYLRHIISRKHPGWLTECYVEIRRREEEARNCYSEKIKVNIDDFDFLEMMVLDGCFLVEFLRRTWHCRCGGKAAADDVIIQLAWPARALWCDLLLLENQIPFFILQKLCDLIDADRQDADLEDAPAKFPPLVAMALNFIFPGSSDMVIRNIMINKLSGTSILHLLHLMYVCWVPKPTGQSATEDKNLPPEERKKGKGIRPRIPCASTLDEADKKPSSEKSKNRRPRIPSASKLKEAGIWFKRMDDSDSLDIRFHNGVIEIPKIHVSDFTKKKFLNLIAFEQCYVHCSKLFTNFATFMDSLIDTAEDVEILHDKGIIYNALGDNGLVASEFSSIAREESISYDPLYLTDVCAGINEYKERFLPRLRASFVHNYCRNPWALVSIIAGSLLLLFGFTQTFFTAFPKFAYKNGDFTRNSP